MFLAPLRGVTIRTFRKVFSPLIRDAGFVEAITPFIPANAGCDPLKDREIKLPREDESEYGFRVTPQFIGKDPKAFREALKRVKGAGYEMADLNAGCPYPMIRAKGRGSGLLRSRDILKAMIEVGCEEMGEGKFSLKTRLGIENSDELLAIMPMINEFPLRFLTVHARTARQMYEGECNREAFARIVEVAKMPIIANGDLPVVASAKDTMVGRAFIRELGNRDDIGEWLDKYVAASREELFGDRPVLGRMKELLAYWKDLPRWRKRWQLAKIARTVDELKIW